MTTPPPFITRTLFTAHLVETPVPPHFRRWHAAWRELHPLWDIEVITLDDLPPIFNHREWADTFRLAEPAGAATRLNLLRYEVLAQRGGVFVDPDRLPLRPLDELLPGVLAFCSTVKQDFRPHALSPSVLAAPPNHPALWHCVRDITDSIARFRGVWDQTGPGFLTRVINDHQHFRDVVPFHWTMFEQSEDGAREHGGAYLYNASHNEAGRIQKAHA